MPPLWLLNTSSYERRREASSKYAILSHRWTSHPRIGDEIDFQSLNPGALRGHNTGLSHHASDESDEDRARCPLCKIKGACAKAKGQSIDWLWVDTCCIDKMNAVEYTRAINSMFEYYRAATVCYGYLYDVAWLSNTPKELRFASKDPERSGMASEWFERGWTLQELLAPHNMEFYDRKWTFMGAKKDLTEHLSHVTRIDKRYLLDSREIKKASLATRLSWMAGRTTGYVEDIAYSMLGILDVNMPAQYGEGAKAFMRLQRMLMESSTDDSIFAWTIPKEGLKCYRVLGKLELWNPSSWGLLAPSPDCFRESRDLVIADQVIPRPYSWTANGVQLLVAQKSGTEATNWLGLPRKEVNLALNCGRHVNGKPHHVVIHLVKRNGDYVRVQCHDLDPTKNAKPSSNSVLGFDQLLRRGLTVTQPEFSPADLIVY
ncbi:hypothetical protein MMC32_008422 [Xylographa parallela]|nr:hypothetical protein [Xylographa parallela]